MGRDGESKILFPTMKSLDADKKASKTSEAAPAEAEKPVEKIDFSKVKVEPLFEEMVDFDTFSKSDFRAVKVKECVCLLYTSQTRYLDADNKFS